MESDAPSAQDSDDSNSYRAHREPKPETTTSTRSSGLEPVDDELDAMLEALANERRRGVIQLLANHGALPLDILTTQIAARETNTPPEIVDDAARKRVYVSLYQSHLPALDEDDIIEFTGDNHAVPGAQFVAVASLLEAIETAHDGPASGQHQDHNMLGADETDDDPSIIQRVREVLF